MWTDVSNEAYPDSDFLYFTDDNQRRGNVGRVPLTGNDWYATAGSVDLGLYATKIAAQEAVENFVNKSQE